MHVQHADAASACWISSVHGGASQDPKDYDCTRCPKPYLLIKATPGCCQARHQADDWQGALDLLGHALNVLKQVAAQVMQVAGDSGPGPVCDSAARVITRYQANSIHLSYSFFSARMLVDTRLRDRCPLNGTGRRSAERPLVLGP